MMSEDEIADAVEPLVRWFQSQNIDPRDAIFIMAKLITLSVKFYAKNEQAERHTRAVLSEYMRIDPLKDDT